MGYTSEGPWSPNSIVDCFSSGFYFLEKTIEREEGGGDKEEY
jgi:hypothetical protein